MILSLIGAQSFALETDTVTLTVVDEINSQTLYSGTVDIGATDTVYSVVNSASGLAPIWASTPPDPTYSPLRIPSNPLYDQTGTVQAQILTELNNLGSVPYESTDLEPWDFYDPDDSNDPVLDRANEALLAEYPDSDGLGLWMGDGTGYSNDGPYMVYIGKDWVFTVNGQTPGITITPDEDHPYSFFEYYMNEALVGNGDTIELTYDNQITPFEY
jgi:hypothetical protein